MDREGFFYKKLPDRLLWLFIIFSAAIHLFLIVYGGRLWWSKNRTEPIEITIYNNPVARCVTAKRPELAPLPQTLKQVALLKPLPAPVPLPRPVPCVDKLITKPRPVEKKKAAGIRAGNDSKPVPLRPAVEPRKEVTYQNVEADQSAHENYLKTVRMLVEQQKKYPKPARLRKFEGKVVIECVVTPSGQVHSIRIARGSSYGILDRAAVRALEDAAPFPKPPPGLFSEGGIRLKIALIYQLI